MLSTLAKITTYDDATNFADLVDSLRGRVIASFPDAESRVALPLFAREFFGRCTQDYGRESGKLAHRRHRVGTLIYPATPEQASAVIKFFFQRLGLCIVDIDTRSLAHLSDEDVEARLATLSEPMAHIVSLRGLGPQADPRVFSAIESAHVDVLVLGFAEPGATFGPTVQRCLRYRIDLQPADELILRPLDAPPLPAGGTLAHSAKPPHGRHTLPERLFDFFHPALPPARP
jgi:hypothetical protein